MARSDAARLSRELDATGLEGRERALAREIAYGVERRRILLDFVLRPLLPRGLPAEPRALAALRIGAYQLLYLTRVPAHAAVDESVTLAGRLGGLVNAVLRRLAGMIRDRPADAGSPRRELALDAGRCLVLAVELPDPGTDPVAHQAVIHGLPEFLVRRWWKHHGAAAAARVAAASDRSPAVHLRATARAPSRAALADALAAAGVETLPGGHPSTLRWTGGESPFSTRAFAEGWFVVQDPTAIRAAEAVGARAGESVLDLCSAPGTKAALLAEAVGAGGRVLAYDTAAARRELVRDNATRLRLPWLEVVDDPGRLPLVDRALVDAPCSNTGVLARRVEVRHRIAEPALARLADGQRRLLHRGLQAVRPGGRVVYSTCSIEPEENEQVVETVAAATGARLVETCTTLPDPPDHDGGFFAVLDARSACEADRIDSAP